MTEEESVDRTSARMANFDLSQLDNGTKSDSCVTHSGNRMASGDEAQSSGQTTCCMLCYNPVLGKGLSIYHSRTYRAQKSLYAKLMEVTNYTAGVPQLVSDRMCTMCYAMLTQIEQLSNQLGQVTAHIRRLFFKMVQIQSGLYEANDTERPPADPAPLGNKPSTAADGPTQPANLHKHPTQESSELEDWPSLVGGGSGGDDVGVLNVSAFLQTSLEEQTTSTPAPAPEIRRNGDYTDDYVVGIESSDAYRYRCKLCTRLGDCEQVIRLHVRADHPGAERPDYVYEPPVKKKKVIVSRANTDTVRARSVSATAPQMTQNIEQRLFVCPRCDKPFGCETFLTRHMESQKCDQLFSCQYCGKEFARSDKKVRHERSHTGERPFVCRFCGRAFSRKDKCTKHERTHDRRSR